MPSGPWPTRLGAVADPPVLATRGTRRPIGSRRRRRGDLVEAVEDAQPGGAVGAVGKHRLEGGGVVVEQRAAGERGARQDRPDRQRDQPERDEARPRGG